MSIRFTEIPERLKYSAKYQGVLSSLHSDIICRVSETFSGSQNEKHAITDILNYVSFMYYRDGRLPDDWNIEDMFNSISYVEPYKLKSVLGETFIRYSDISWNIEPVFISDDKSLKIPDYKSPEISDSKFTPAGMVSKPVPTNNSTLKEISTISDISLYGPVIPRIDTSKIYTRSSIDGTIYCIYHSLPEIPSKQCEISLTTDPDTLSDFDYLNLYPNNVLNVRNAEMYKEYTGLYTHPLLGVIFPIEDFTQDQIIDNIIRYPNVEDIFRIGTVAGNKKFITFGKYIEIDGKLELTKNVWDGFKNIENIPKTKEFIQEYVVRRYILEKEIKNIQHNYEMFGILDEYLSLFMPISEYNNLGYTDNLGMAKKCVMSRISYISSRNPVLRRIASDD